MQTTTKTPNPACNATENSSDSSNAFSSCTGFTYCVSSSSFTARTDNVARFATYRCAADRRVFVDEATRGNAAIGVVFVATRIIFFHGVGVVECRSFRRVRSLVDLLSLAHARITRRMPASSVALDAIQRARTTSSALENLREWFPGIRAEDDALRRAKDTASASSAAAGVMSSDDAGAHRERGNEAFRRGDYSTAIEAYDRSVATRPSAAALANRAMCRLKLEEWAAAEADCTAALELDPAYGVKAYMRRGTARRHLKKYLDSVMDFEEALRLEPTSKILREERLTSQRMFELEAKVRPTQPRRRLKIEEEGAETSGQGDDNSRMDDDASASPTPAESEEAEEVPIRVKREEAPKSAPDALTTDLVKRATEIASKKPITAPRNGAEFERAYRREMKAESSDEEASLSRRAAVIGAVYPDDLVRFFSGGLDSDILIDIARVTTLIRFPSDPHSALRSLEVLQSLPRFAVSVAFASASAKSSLRDAVTVARAATTDPSHHAGLDGVSVAFKL